MPKNILITGSSGIIGSFLYNKLKFKHQLTGVDIVDSSTVDTVISELTDILDLFEESDFDIVFNLAALTDTKKTHLNYDDVNCHQIAKIRKAWKDIYIVQASTMLADLDYFSTLDENTLRYGRSKYLCEEAIKNSDNTLIVRFPMVYSNNMNKYHTIKFEVFALLFTFFTSDFTSTKKSMLSVDKILDNFELAIMNREIGMHYWTDDFLQSIEDLSFFVAKKRPIVSRAKIPTKLLMMSTSVLPPLKRMFLNSSLKYDFR